MCSELHLAWPNLQDWTFLNSTLFWVCVAKKAKSQRVLNVEQFTSKPAYQTQGVDMTKIWVNW